MPLIGVDWGGKRIGIAVSASGVLATPHSVIANDGTALQRLDELARELDAEALVVGVAKRVRSTAGERKFHEFADQLRQKTCRAVVLWDETLSTVEAADKLRAGGRKSKKAQSDIDMYAAAVILQSYIDGGGRTP